MLFTCYFYKLSFSKINYKKIMNSGLPKYEKLYHEIKNEYDLLSDKYDFIPAEVIHQNMNHINNIFIINQGKKHNIREKSFVINDKGLIGVVLKTFNDISIVKTIDSANTNISVEVDECYGTLKSIRGKLVIDDILKCPNVLLGDPVFTSKYNYSSSNIIIGYITDIKSDKYYVTPTVNKFEVRYVGVINDNN